MTRDELIIKVREFALSLQIATKEVNDFDLVEWLESDLAKLQEHVAVFSATLDWDKEEHAR